MKTAGQARPVLDGAQGCGALEFTIGNFAGEGPQGFKAYTPIYACSSAASGAQGPQGAVGPAGLSGLEGLPGAQGSKGAPGPQGPAGVERPPG